MSVKMRIKLINKSEYVRMMWKNGLGMTDQIDIYPPSAPFPSETFLWRLSSATVKESNPFSAFPQCDRILAVLRGDGLLVADNIIMKPLLEPLKFSGDEPVNCQLIGETEVTDLGIIYRRSVVDASMTFRSIPENCGLHSICLPDGVNYLICTSGSFAVDDFVLSCGDTLLLEKCRDSKIQLFVSKKCEFFHVNVHMISTAE